MYSRVWLAPEIRPLLGSKLMKLFLGFGTVRNQVRVHFERNVPETAVHKIVNEERLSVDGDLNEPMGSIDRIERPDIGEVDLLILYAPHIHRIAVQILDKCLRISLAVSLILESPVPREFERTAL